MALQVVFGQFQGVSQPGRGAAHVAPRCSTLVSDSSVWRESSEVTAPWRSSSSAMEARPDILASGGDAPSPSAVGWSQLEHSMQCERDEEWERYLRKWVPV